MAKEKPAPEREKSAEPGRTSADTGKPDDGKNDRIPRGFPVVGIGASAGGLEALEKFFKAMPPDAGIAFVLVVHLDPKHISILPELLQKHTDMPVDPVRDCMAVKPDHVYVIPPNKDLSILNGTLQLLDLVKPRGANLPIDNFLRSLARDQGRNAVCTILSGTGTDGTLGLKAIKGELGMTMVQDEASAKYGGMPSSAIATGLADYILPPEKMPKQLIAYTRHATKSSGPRIEPVEGPVPQALQKIFVLLRSRTEHDFSLYKKNTICRRIERRMNVHQIDDISDYVRYLQKSERESDILFKELLIGVTNFFRDPAAFEVLQTRILPRLLDGKPDDYALRVWVPGCASGEEAYSVAIVLQECMEVLGRHFHVQIFGTDIDEDAIAVARAGRYPESIMADVGPERLKRFFSREDNGQYRVKKMIRESLVFAPQNVIKDPPFTKLDLLCSRNLLIYLGTELQRRLLPIFHYSLKPDGILFLGSSESIGQTTDLFTPEDKKWKIFRRKVSSASAHPMVEFQVRRASYDARDIEAPETVRRSEELSALQLVETILQQSEMTPCAIINDACNVVYIHGRTGRFLEPAEGKASVNILEMARRGMRSELAAAIRQVTQHKQEVVCRDLQVEHNGSPLNVNVTVRPILEQIAMRGLMMVLFEETAGTSKKRGRPKASAAKRRGRSVDELDQELQFTRENLQTTIEELETSNEELKSTNEELQSTNEELQSTNEELETSKEELQSLNEESSTVNAELQARIEELSKANDDMKNLLDSTEIATIFLDTELQIRRYTPRAMEIIPLTPVDCGRPVGHLVSTLIGTDLTEIGQQVLRDLAVRELEVVSDDNRYYIMRVRPYRTTANVIEGVVITFENITQLKLAEMAREASERIQGLSLEVGRIGAFELNLEDGSGVWTPQVADIWGIPDGFEGNLVSYCWERVHPQDLPWVKAEFDSLIESREMTEMEFRVVRPDKTIRWLRWRGQVMAETGSPLRAIGVNQDITARVLSGQALKESEERQRLILELTGEGIYEISATGEIVFANEAYARMFGYTVEEFIGRNWSDVVHPEALEQDLEMNKTLLDGQTVEGESKGLHKDGHLIRTRFRASPIFRDDKLVRIIGTIRPA